MRWLFPVVLTLVCVACEHGPVGRPCTSDRDCLEGLSCLSSGSSRACTRSCFEVGAERECPGGAICASTSGQRRCAPLCQTAGECAADQVCEAVPPTSWRACLNL